MTGFIFLFFILDTYVFRLNFQRLISRISFKKEKPSSSLDAEATPPAGRVDTHLFIANK